MRALTHLLTGSCSLSLIFQCNNWRGDKNAAKDYYYRGINPGSVLEDDGILFTSGIIIYRDIHPGSILEDQRT
jgi:hypothetical protein